MCRMLYGHNRKPRSYSILSNISLEIGSKLLITVLPNGQTGGEQKEWLYLSKLALAYAYGDNEPEYSLDMIKEVNPEYEGR
jgi:hypothetical protein